MKDIIKLAYVVPYTLAVSCSSFLDKKPQSDLTQEDTGTEDQKSKYGSLADTRAELRGTYESFEVGISQSENYTAGDMQSDSCCIGGDGVVEWEFDLLKLASTNYKIELVWSQRYSIAGTVASAVGNVKMMGPTSTVAEGRDRIAVEAKLLRAWVHFDIVRLWDDIPMVLDLIPTITAENLDEWYPVMHPKRSAIDKTYDQVLDDLDRGNTTRYLVGKNRGTFQAIKGAVYALHVKVLAMRGEKLTRDCTKMVEACDKVITESYALINNFDGLW